ncbi:MAG: amidoligase family protein [Defluviitaleaceae bacterium]|nr:amidoligase family protein [Defluviitaleaceae bacterium]
MFTAKFGIEIEFTGITRELAAKIAAEYLNGTITNEGDYYDTKTITAPDGRKWKFMFDSSITAQQKVGGRKISASDKYKVELVSPILTYREDIDTLQELIRRLRKAGGFAPDTAGIHIHLNGADHTPRSLRNFINIIASRNDLLYKALQVKADRMRYCKKMDNFLVERMNAKKPQTFEAIKKIWYEGYTESTNQHYHSSRYHFCNLHSFFTRNNTVELRGFNGTLHAGKIRSYILLALALNNQALTQKSASSRKNQTENEKFAMRTYLNRIGFIGNEFKNCREHLCKHLSGSAAWRFRTA